MFPCRGDSRHALQSICVYNQQSSCSSSQAIVQAAFQHAGSFVQFQHFDCFWQLAPILVKEGVAKALAKQQNSRSRLASSMRQGNVSLLVHGSLVIGNRCQHISHDAAWANGIHPHIVWRQS